MFISVLVITLITIAYIKCIFGMFKKAGANMDIYTIIVVIALPCLAMPIAEIIFRIFKIL